MITWVRDPLVLDGGAAIDAFFLYLCGNYDNGKIFVERGRSDFKK